MRFLVGVLALVFVLAALGCGSAPAGQSGGYAVTDAEGRTVAFAEKPVRVLNYALWLDDIVLGLVPPERLVGIDHLADDPNSSNIVEIAEKIPVKLNQPSAEQVIALHPDVVFLDAGKDAAVAETLRDLGIHVVACQKPRTADEVRAAVQLVLAAVLLYYHIRIEFDRRVFQDFADGRYTPEAFDQTLRQTGLRRVSDGLSMPQRVSGAIALWRKSLYLTAAQLLILLVQSV